MDDATIDYMMENSELRNEFNKWFDKNLFYCEDTHSFVHRCFNIFKECENYREAQHKAFRIFKEMKIEFLLTKFKDKKCIVCGKNFKKINDYEFTGNCEHISKHARLMFAGNEQNEKR